MSASPASRRRDSRRAVEHHPQPALLPAIDGRSARIDRKSHVRHVQEAVSRKPRARHRVGKPTKPLQSAGAEWPEAAARNALTA
ncbi:hypothetical protein [Caballeronia telluris]|uniref:hypothetical protein n=1 Tax=Caballeronia telluris TaxID=326475 RepID=UPI0038990501